MLEIERDIENYLTKKVKSLNGWCIKLNSNTTNGLPDRLVLLPNGFVYFVELKAPHKKPRPTQKVVHRRLKALGFNVFVIDSREGVERFVQEIRAAQIPTKSDR